MMTQHTIAGHTIFSLTGSASELKDKLLINGNHVYNKYMEIYEKTNFSYFRTPYEMDPKSTGPGYQYEPENAQLKKEYAEFCISSLESMVEGTFEIRDMWYLNQPNEDWVDNPSHQHLTSDYVAVMYLSASTGDHIIFYDTDNKPHTYNIGVGELIIFGSNVFHKPGPTSSTKRISVNAELNQTG